MGFSNVSTRPQASSSIQSGNVIKVDPNGGTSIKSNASVVLTYSSGATQVKVPSVVGQPEAQATQALRAAGFIPTVTQANSSTVAQGTVIATNPAGGQNAAQGSNVHVVVSSGIKQVTIPSLVGQDPASAGQQLGSLGLVVTSASESSASIPAGAVTRTNPPSGASVPVGSSVTVYVSSGPPQVSVPDLTGKTQDQAQAALQAVGLKLGQVTSESVPRRNEDGTVQSQDPASGSSVAQGSQVDIVLGSFQPGSTTTTTTSSSTTAQTGNQG
jgi:serine/threonine-protein kinase